MKRLTGFAFLTAALLVGKGAQATNVTREVGGWYNDGWNAEAHAVYMVNDNIFSEVSPYWYDLGSPQNLTATNGSISERAYAYTAQNVVDAHANGDLVIPAVADHATGQIDAILNNPTARQNLINNIVGTVQQRGYDGIDLNFESGTSASRTQFTAFVNDLATALHGNGKRLEITVKAVASPTEEGWYIFDYAGLGASGADRIKIMAYDHNFDGGANVPGPIAPVPWIRTVLTYAIATRHVPSSKIQLGVHDYGWTWKKVGAGWQILSPTDTYQGVMLKSASVPWEWDATAKEAWKQYSYGGKTYRSYVGTADSVAARLALADEFNLAGITLWALGREDSAIYSRMCAAFGSSCGAPSVHPALLSQGKPATASSSFDTYYVAPRAFDGNLVDGWLANPAETSSWLSVDLQATYNLTQVKIYWGGHDWSRSYDVQTSNDGATWTTVYHEANNADGGLDTINLQTSGRYVRVLCNGAKSDNWSYEIYELQVSGLP